MQYNGELYNEDEYNLTNHVALLTESMTSADVLLKEMGLVKIETQPTMDALSDGVSLAAFLDTVTLLQRATYGAVYNSLEYDAGMYNRTADNDEVLLHANKALSDAISSGDVIAALDAAKVLADPLSGTDAISLHATAALIDFMFLSEFFRIEMTNKGLSDTVRLADWLTIKQSPQTNNWGD